MSKNRRPKSESIFWFRRDLRLEDNAGLYHALKNKTPVRPIFIFDKNILESLPQNDARVTFIHQSLAELNQELNSLGSQLFIYHGKPKEVFSALLKENEIEAIYTNHDYEPYAIQRDREVLDLCKAHSVPFFTYKDQCIFEKSEVTKDDGSPYTVFTPYKKKWLKNLEPYYYQEYALKKYKKNFAPYDPKPLPSLKDLGFKKSELVFPSKKVRAQILQNYDKQRDYPALDATSRLGVHLRFGTISIRKCVQIALKTNDTWLSELIWRDFFMQILFHFPHVENNSFRPDYDKIKWLNKETHFLKWCEGQTGYPLVDAGMHELNATGYMHNRVRMLVASFLTKHLLIDWRKGERYFAKKLLDYDMSANNGNWQWAAGTGCDAAPYFRVFNPTEQQKKFDPDFKYIKKWAPEYMSPTPPTAIVEHKMARDRALTTYKVALKK